MSNYDNGHLKMRFPFMGGVELARAAIDHYGDSIIDTITPIFNAIKRTDHAEGDNDTGQLAMLAEAIQYRDIPTLQYMADTGLYKDAKEGERPSAGLRERCRAIVEEL